jgi:hypothetical protein
MGSTISDNQFTIHVSNNLTTDYNLQLTLMEKSVEDSEKPLSSEAIKAELSLPFERLNVSRRIVLMMLILQVVRLISILLLQPGIPPEYL